VDADGPAVALLAVDLDAHSDWDSVHVAADLEADLLAVDNLGAAVVGIGIGLAEENVVLDSDSYHSDCVTVANYFRTIQKLRHVSL
jgi:hypothetical protein